MMVKNPILITGCARSGTSMTAGIIHTCGAFGGILAGPNRNNKKGMFENITIRNAVIKPFLREVGSDPLGQFPLPNIDILPDKSNEIRDKILCIMQSQGLQLNMNWFYKGAKLCLIWPVIHEAFPEAKWVIVRRKESQIIHSCMRTSFMRAFDVESGWKWWIEQHLKRFQEMKDIGLNIREIWPVKVINKDLRELKNTINWLGLEWKQKEVTDFVSPSLWYK